MKKAKKEVLLDFNEEGYNELLKKQNIIGDAIKELTGYCEVSLQIRIESLDEFFKSPKKYCVDAYWKKYSGQFGKAPVKKEKAIELSDWEESKFMSLLTNAEAAFRTVSNKGFEFKEDKVLFSNDPEEFKRYLREEDREDYDNTLKFIEMANKMEEMGGKPAWFLARYYKTMADENNSLVPSKVYFTSSENIRNRPIERYL